MVATLHNKVCDVGRRLFEGVGQAACVPKANNGQVYPWVLLGIAMCVLCDFAGSQVELVILLSIFMGYHCWLDSQKKPKFQGRCDVGGETTVMRCCEANDLSPEQVEQPAKKAKNMIFAGFNLSLRTGQWEMALSLIDRARREQAMPMLTAYSMAMRACNKGGRSDKTLDLFDEMQSESIEPDIFAYNSAIHACALEQKVETAIELTSEMRSKNIDLDVNSYVALIDVYHKCGFSEKGWQVYRDAMARGVTPTAKLFKSLSDCIDDRRWRESGLEIYTAMISHGLFPTFSTQGCLIVAWKNKLPPMVAETFWTLRAEGGKLSPTAYGCLMLSYERSNPERTLELCEEMVANSVKFDRVAFNSTMCSLVQLGRCDEVLQFFETMQARLLEPNEKTYGVLLHACSRSHRAEMAISVFNTMLEEGMSPNNYAYRDVIRSCLERKQLEHAFKFYRDMTSKNINPCLNTASWLLSECSRQGWKDEFAEISRDLKLLKSRGKGWQDSSGISTTEV